MHRAVITIILSVLSLHTIAGHPRNRIIADSVTRKPLPSASVFDRQGNFIGITNTSGITPQIHSDSYPITIRYIGFKERLVHDTGCDTIFLDENISQLPEIVVETNARKVLHIMAYVREYSTLSTYTDTVFMFREKTVDYMLTPDKKLRYRGWTHPRTLACESYYRFTNSLGLDSVSDKCNNHFSWSDWVGVAPLTELPSSLINVECATDTFRGKYSPVEIWIKNNDKISVDINVLADTSGHRWVPNLTTFFRQNLDFENIRLRLNYDNPDSYHISPSDITGYSFIIESNGRGHDMFGFNKAGQSVFVSTYAEVYIIDKEFITVKEAKEWESRKLNMEQIGIITPAEAPELQPNIYELIARVYNIDQDSVRLAFIPDSRLAGIKDGRRNFNLGRRALDMLKQLTGISRYKTRKNEKQTWKNFRNSQRKRNAN